MDRDYLDFHQLHRFTRSAAFFVIRARTNLQLRRRHSHPVDRSLGLQSDHTVVLCGKHTDRKYPQPLRRIRYLDPEQGRSFPFLTNCFTSPALTITQLYRSRWQIELFFRSKQHLRIRRFYGVTDNAVKTQIWIAVTVYALAAIARKRLGIPHSLYNFLQVLGVTSLEKTPISTLFSRPEFRPDPHTDSSQLTLLDL